MRGKDTAYCVLRESQMMSKRNHVSECGMCTDAREPRWRAVLTWLGLCVALVLSAPMLVSAQSTVDTYLHGSGGTANPPSLFLDATAPTTSTAKYKDSSSINFNGGNAWQLVGTWPTSSVPAAGKLTALTSLHAWLGLKNSDDQGTNFDLLAEVYKNGDLVTSGLTRCRTGITTNPASAAETLVAFGSFASASLNGTSDTLSVKIWTRIGTNADNTKCAGHNNAVGLRLYFDATTRAARLGLTLAPPDPTPSTLTPNPLAITAGATGTLTATITPAPPGAGSLTVSSANTGVATVPASVSFAANQTQIPIPVNGIGVGNAQITVSLNGGTVTSTVEVNPPSLTITNLSPATLAITQGAAGTLTVTISAAQQTNTTVTLTSSAPSIAFVPNQVVVPANLTTAAISVSANTPGSADITASLNGSQATSTVTVTPALPTIVSLQPPVLPITLGASGTLTVTLSATQTGATTIAVTASPAGLVTVPATVIVPANQLSITIPVGTVALGTAMVHVSLNGSMAESAVQVTPPPPTVVALSPSPLTVAVGATGQLTVMLSAAQPTNITVTLAVDNSTVIQIPSSVPVPANQTQAQFTVTGLTTGTAVVTATLGTSSQQATVHVVPPPPQVVSLLPNPLPLQQGATSSLTLTISAAQPIDTVVPLTNDHPTLVQAPLSETVPAGQTQTMVSVTGLLTGNAVLTATLNGSSVSSTVQVTPPPPVVTALGPVPPTLSPLTLPKGKPGVLRVTLSRAPTAPTTVTLTSNAPTIAAVPASVPVPAGSLTIDFPVNTVGQGTATITASLNGGSANATVVVTAPEVDAVTLSPLTPSVFATEPVQFTATATMTDGTTQPLTTGVTWTSATATVATIDSTGLATTITAGTTTIKAATTNALGPVTGDTLLTVQPAPALALTPVSGTLAVGQSLNLVVTSPAPAGPNGLTVNLVQVGTGSVTMVPTTVIPANGTTNSVVITGATFGQVTITASAVGRLPANATFTILPAAPTIAGFTPTSGSVGTPVTITGTNLNGAGSGTTTVKFNTTNAIITSVSATSLTTTVPQGATTGLITVTTPGGTAISAQTFTFTTSQDFSLTVAPVGLSVVQGRPITTQVQLVNTGNNPVTGFVALAAVGLPTGMTGAFTPSQIAGGQTATLTLNSGTAPAGAVTITVTATTVVEGQTIVRQSPLTVTVLAAGGTTLAGRILATKDDAPIPGARVKIGALSVFTDASGNFLFPTAPAGSQVLLIDGPSALYPGDLPVQMTVQPGVANVLPYPVFLHEVGQNYFPISQGGQTIVAPADIPGFSMMIPAGTTITGWDNQPNVKVSVVPVPIDRLPIPTLPSNVPAKQVYMFNFGKPGGGFPSRPIPIIMPNDSGAAPGTRMDMWYYDEGPTPDPNGHRWKIYGQGTVSADGTSVIPDPGVGQPKFCCGGGSSVPTGGGGVSAAALRFFDLLSLLDPVMAQTGMFSLEQTDLVLPGRIPVVIRRAYHSQDPGLPPDQPPARELVNSSAFGFNTTLMDYDDRLVGDGTGQTLTYTSGFSRERFSLQTDGTYRADRTPMLAGMIGRRNQDGSSTLRDKNGTVRSFGTDGWLRSITDRNGNSVTIVRSGTQIQQIIEPGGRALTFQYTGGGISQITDPLGRTVRYTYEASPSPWGNARLRTVENPAGGVTTYGYTGPFNIASITDARGITYLTNTYCSGTCPLDPAVVTQTMADGGVSQIDYVVTNQTITQTTITDPRGNKTVHRFNTLGHEVQSIDALGQQTRLTRDFVTNRVMEIRDPLNRLTKYTYDAAGNVTSVLDPQGNPTLFEYEPAFNQVTKITDALNQITRFTYDPATGNLLTTTDPLNHQTTIAYNAVGQPTSVTDPLTNTTSFTYDAVGNLETVLDPLGNRTQRTYDAVSRLTALIDPRGKTTQFTYDPLNQVTQITDAINGLTGFTYDPNGNLLTVADAKNQTTTYVHDNMDRLQTRTDALNRTESYQYDLASNLTRFTDRKNQITNFQYDPIDRRTLSSYHDGTSVAVAYDAVGNVTKLTDSAVGAIDWAYDVLDHVTQEVTPQGIVSYTYDALSRRYSMRANAQQPVTYTYDANSQLSQVAQGVINGVLTHDALGRRTQLQRSNGVTTTYAYDTASRLAGLTHVKGATVLEQLTYGLDQADNKTQVQQAQPNATALPPAVQAAYDAANQQAQFAGATLTYDSNGNLISDGTNTYVWDARARLIGISGGTIAAFSYDALDRRISKTINGATTSYLYDGADVVTEAGASNATYLSTLNIDEPLIRQASGGNEYYHTDDLGSTVALSDDAGAVTTRYTYGPFGSTTVTGVSTNPFQFTGRENDGTGLYYYRARYYSPSHSRFLSEDPLEFDAGNPNLYAYVFNNPANFVDPSGTLPTVVKQCLAGLVKSAAKAAGADLAGRKPGGDPLNPIDAIQVCLGGPNKGQPTAKALHRPYTRKGTRQEVEARAPRTPDGRPIDPNTGQPINGKPDLGHKTGNEFRTEKARAEAEGLTQKEFNERMNNPDLYQLEDRSSNRSRRFEYK